MMEKCWGFNDDEDNNDDLGAASCAGSLPILFVRGCALYYCFLGYC
jgi:hypothetical protein